MGHQRRDEPVLIAVGAHIAVGAGVVPAVLDQEVGHREQVVPDLRAQGWLVRSDQVERGEQPEGQPRIGVPARRGLAVVASAVAVLPGDLVHMVAVVVDGMGGVAVGRTDAQRTGADQGAAAGDHPALTLDHTPEVGGVRTHRVLGVHRGRRLQLAGPVLGDVDVPVLRGQDRADPVQGLVALGGPVRLALPGREGCGVARASGRQVVRGGRVAQRLPAEVDAGPELGVAPVRRSHDVSGELLGAVEHDRDGVAGPERVRHPGLEVEHRRGTCTAHQRGQPAAGRRGRARGARARGACGAAGPGGTRGGGDGDQPAEQGRHQGEQAGTAKPDNSDHSWNVWVSYILGKHLVGGS